MARILPWILLLFLALAAFLVAGVVNGVFAWKLRSTGVEDAPRLEPAQGAVDAPTETDRIIVERNYVGSKTVAPEVETSPAAGFQRLEPHLAPGTVERLLQTGAGGPWVSLQCHVVEGWFCFRGEGQYDQPLPRELASTVIDELNPKHVEHGNHNGVGLRCSRPSGTPACEIDWGWGKGWEPLVVR